MKAMRRSRVLLCVALLALSVLYSAWFHDDRHLVAALLVFTLPPLAALVAVVRGGATSAFWAGVVALLWFCHGVVVAWSRPAESGFGWGVIVLSLVIVLAASWPGLYGRFGRRKATP